VSGGERSERRRSARVDDPLDDCNTRREERRVSRPLSERKRDREIDEKRLTLHPVKGLLLLEEDGVSLVRDT
jgi:hypothetical protein